MPRAARWLAERFEVSTRTIERDLAALVQSGVPVCGDRGRLGGYVLDTERSLPPLQVTPAEAVAISVALRELHGAPFEGAARTALEKLAAMMPEPDLAKVDQLADRVRVVGTPGPKGVVPRAVRRALEGGRALRLRYRDRNEEPSTRTVEPMGLMHGPKGWYLLAWCRLRGAPRAFALDRVHDVERGEEVEVDRRIDLEALGMEVPTLRAVV